MLSLPDLITSLGQYPGAVTDIAEQLGCSTDKIYRVLNGRQRKDKTQILIACADYIADRKALERTATNKIMAALAAT